jgi:MraZ protein
MLVFTGRYDYTIDEKGRLSIPSRLRDQVTRDGQPLSFFVTRGRKGQLSAYPENQYHQLVDDLGSKTDDESSEALRAITADTEECPVDAQGRLVISPRLRAAVGIKRDVVILGVSKRVEIWDKAGFEKYQKDGAPRIQSATANIQGRSDLL